MTTFGLIFFTEHGGLSHETFNYIHMILGKHGGNGVIFGRKFEQSKVIGLRIAQAGHVAGRYINIRKFVNSRIGNQLKVLEGKGLAKIQFFW